MLLSDPDQFWSIFHFDELINAYIPLMVWTGVGLVASRFAPINTSKFMGITLYWVGVPLQLFVLARHTKFSDTPYIPYVAIAALILSWLLALVGWQFAKQEHSDRSSLGSFILATMLGNTGFVGLTLTTSLASSTYADWAVLYSIASNVAGNYGIAVFIASYFGKSEVKPPWWKLLLDVATVPSLWAFAIGWYTRPIGLPDAIGTGLDMGGVGDDRLCVVFSGTTIRQNREVGQPQTCCDRCFFACGGCAFSDRFGSDNVWAAP